MTNPREKEILETGRKIFLQADTPSGRVSTTGVVIDVGNFAFRVKCKKRFSKNDFDPGQEVRITLTDKKGMLPVTTQFVRLLDDDSKVVILRLPSADWQKNRRNFFRGEIALKVTIIKSDGPRFEGTTENISGGGLLVLSEAMLQPNEDFQVIIRVSKKETIGVRARVVWTNYRTAPHRYGFKFIDIKPRDQNRICRMVMVMEFEQRRATIRELNERSAIR